MKWVDHNGEKLSALSQAGEIIKELNRGALVQGIMSTPYFLHAEQRGRTIISNVPSDIYEKLEPSQYLPPENIESHIKSLLSNLMGQIDTFQNIGKEWFQLNQCHLNSISIFDLIEHLASIKINKLAHSAQIILGYVARKIPFGTQVGNFVIENNSIWLHDWHIWNYVEKILIDVTLFKNGNLIPIDGNITSWGAAEDHVFIFPPQGTEYWGAPFENKEKFNQIVGQIIGFQ